MSTLVATGVGIILTGLVICLFACLVMTVKYPNGYVEPSPQYRSKLYDLLSAADQVLTKHNIPYWIESGTLLGAVRHRGFIPWDDDIDIIVPEEYIPKLGGIAPDLRKYGMDVRLENDCTRILFALCQGPPSIFAKVNGLGVIHLAWLLLRWRRTAWIWKLVQRYSYEVGVRFFHRFFQWSSSSVDIGYKTDHGDRYEYSRQNARELWPGESIIWKEELYPLKRYPFGPIEVFGPNHPEPYLQRAYGDWKVGKVRLGHNVPGYCYLFAWWMKKTVIIPKDEQVR